MAALITLGAVIAGLVVGISNGGRLDRIADYRPALWPALAGGLLLQLIIRVAGLQGGWAVALELISAIALLAFAVVNIRLGGMVLIVAGLAFNLVPTIVNWGIPTSRDALVTAGVIEADTTGTVTLEGPRHVATDADSFTWLGETIALPTGNVISFGDVVLYAGYLLVTASLVRGRVLRTDAANYRTRIAPLGQGPARRRGPGLHPSRLDPRQARQRPRPTTEQTDADEE